jgi:pimeloyl-ACP methyl ester carboxylesterase
MTQSPSSLAETRYLDGPNARYAYRRFGAESGVPLVLALRFRGTMDHWDPAFLDRLASSHDVIIFDNVGHGKTGGTAPTTMDALADGLIDFVDALALAEIDLLGWSLGGIVVQAVTLRRPDLVRRSLPIPRLRNWRIRDRRL